MGRTVTTRSFTLAGFLSIAAALITMIVPSALALPAYSSATGQPCSACHVNPGGGGTLTSMGQAFAAIPTHSTNPAAAWAAVSGAATPAPTAPETPPQPPSAPSTAPTTPSPAAAAGVWSSGPLSVTLSGANLDGTVAYTAMLRNSGTADITNLYLALSLPAGVSMAVEPMTPEGAAFAGQGGGAAWIVNTVPGGGVAGPFVFTASRGTATNLSASAFVHWTGPAESSFSTPGVTPISNDERMAIEQAIVNRLNTVDRTTELWNIQPGLGTVMIEYTVRFDNLWFAAQAGNWQMVRYQIAEMTEIQEVGETTRPARAPALKNFEMTYLDPLDEMAQAGNLGDFVAAYDNAIGGCNACHASSTGVPPDRNLPAKFIKVMRPTAPVFPNVDWSGQ